MNPQSFFKWLSVSALLSVSIAAKAADNAYVYKMVSFNDGSDNFDGWVRSDGTNSKIYSTRLPENYSKTWLSCWAFSEAEWGTDDYGNSTTCFPYKRPSSIEVKKDTQSEWSSVTVGGGTFLSIPEGYDQIRVTFGSAPKAMTLGEAITQTEAINLTDFPEMDILVGTLTDRGIMASGEQTQAVEISIPCTSASALAQAYATITYSSVYVQEFSLGHTQTSDIGPTSVSATAVTTDNRTVTLPLYSVICLGGRFYHEDACLLPANIAAIRIRWEFADAPSYATDTEPGIAYYPIYVRSNSSDSSTAETKFLTIAQAAGPGNTDIGPGVISNAAIDLTEPSSKAHYWIDITGEGVMEYLENDHYSSSRNESHNVYGLSAANTSYSGIGVIPFTPMTWMPSGKPGVMYTYDGFSLYSIDSELKIENLYTSSSKAALIDYDNDGRLDLVYPDIKKVVSITPQGEVVESEFKVWTRAEYLDLHPSGGYDLGSGLSVIGGSTATPATFHTFTQIDMNGDGYADFLDTQAGKCYLNLGDGSFVEDSFSGQIFLRDFDGDGQQDILRYNSSDKSFTIYYTGKSGSAAQKKLLSGLETNGHVWCYDFNRDGHTDIVIPVNAWKDGSGNLREDACIVLFLNDGKGSFKRKEAPFDGYVCFDDCADIDGDGYYEVIGRRIITNDGAAIMLRYTNQYISCRIKDTPDSELSVISEYNDRYTLYENMFAAPITGNGTLYYIGQWSGGYKATPFPTQTGARPTKPAAPTATFDAEENEITITWESVSDPIVPAGDFTYELRIGTTPGADDLMHVNALADGTRRDLAEGNNGHSRTRKLNARSWPQGNIYISVQAIDPSHRGSEFSDYTIARKRKPASDFDIFAPNRATRGDEITLKAKVNAAADATVSWEYGDATVISESANELRLTFATAGKKNISRTVSLSDGSTATSTHALTIAPVRFSAAAVQPRAAIDLDLDGTAEIIADGYFHEETPDGEIAKLKGLFNNKSISAAYFADINRDGYPDVLTNDGILLNESDRMMSYEEPDGYNLHWLLADFNNDGLLDAVGGNQYHLQENLGDYISFNDLEYDAARSTSNLGDFNGDGLIDFRYGTTLYINNGDMTFRSEEIDTPEGAYTSLYRDIDGDGKPDLLYYYFDSTGNGNYFPHIAWGDGSDTEIPQISGYNCNGWSDLLFDFDNNGCLDGIVHYINYADSKNLSYAILFNADHSFSMVEMEKYNARAATRYAADGAIHVCGNRMSGHTNTPPSAPDGLRSKTENGMLVIEWNPATDQQTPQNMLRYVVSVRHKGAEGEGAYFISPLNGGKNGIPLASATDYGTTFYDKGTYQVCSGVNFFTAPIISIPLANIPSGDYEVKVQAVDLQDMPGNFSATYELNVNSQGYISLPECTGVDVETLIKFGADTDPATIDYGQDSRVVSVVKNSAKVAWSSTGIKHITGQGIDATIEVIETPSAYTPLPPSVPYNSVLRIPQDPRFEHKWRIRVNDGIGPRKPSFISAAATTAENDEAEPDNSFTELIVGQDLRGYIVSHTVTTPWGAFDSYEQTIMPDRAIDVAVGIVTINEDANKYEIIEPTLRYSDGIEVTSKAIYRESEVTGQYELIGEVKYEDRFLDTSSAPESHASRYKVVHHYSYSAWGSEATGRSLLTNCKAAQPIHANISPGMGSEWNIVWTPYEGREVTSYRIMRGDSKSTLECIATVSGSITAYTDHTAPARRQFYAVETLFDVSAASREGNIWTARSNISDTENWQSGLEEITGTGLSAEVIGNTLHVSGIKTAARVRIIAVNGSEVLEATLDTQSATVAGFERLPRGVFLIVIDTPEEGTTVKRIVR